MSGLLSKIKNDVAKSGSNKAKIIYFREGQKRRIRFLQDMDDGMEITIHDSFEKGVTVVCRETFGESCEFCDDDDLRTRSFYIWSVYDYDDNEVKLFMFPVNRCSPIPSLMAMYENYGTLLDRDYVITVQGKQVNKTYGIIPMDKAKFRNQKVKPYSEKKVLEIVLKAYPYPDDDEDTGASFAKPKAKRIRHDEPDDDQSDYDDSEMDGDDDSKDYSGMSALELYKECKSRGIDAMKKKPARYYVNLLEEDDRANDDWGDEDEDDSDEWEDEDE